MTAHLAAAPGLADLADYADDMRAAHHPHITTILDALLSLAAADHDADDTDMTLELIGGEGPNLINLLGQVAAHLGNPATNPTIAQLPEPRRRKVADLTAQFAHLTADHAGPEYIAEACAQIAGI